MAPFGKEEFNLLGILIVFEIVKGESTLYQHIEYQIFIDSALCRAG